MHQNWTLMLIDKLHRGITFSPFKMQSALGWNMSFVYRCTATQSNFLKQELNLLGEMREAGCNYPHWKTPRYLLSSVKESS